MNFKALAALSCGLALSGWAQSYVYNSNPTREFGQISVTTLSGAPNLVEGREFYVPQSVAVDNSVTPPILYVADTGNNRVLAWKDATAFTKTNFADKVIGQPDFTTTIPGGPQYGTSSGLTFPNGLAVDANGNLYVMDAQNNRILRYPKPLQQGGDFPTPDLVIGQTSFTSGISANQGSTIPNAQTVFLSGTSFPTGIAFDKQGNLWVSDFGNNRVLRYPASALAAGQSGIAADLVLGQTSFNVGTAVTPNLRTNKAGFSGPSGLALSSDGDLYVSDSFNRVLYFKAPFATGQSAVRIIGVVVPTKDDPNPRTGLGCPSVSPYPCAGTLGSVTAAGGVVPPAGLAVLGNNLFVADPGNGRVVKFDVPANWPAECLPTSDNPTCPAGAVYSPPGLGFIGQGNDGTSVKANRGQRDPSADSLNAPEALAFIGSDLVVADTFNQRVVVYAAPGYISATRLLGQLDWNYSGVNLVEGRELNLYGGFSSNSVNGGSGMVVDTSSTPPRLYIADTLNNRVLGFKDARNVQPGDPTNPRKADIVIGQADLFHTTANYATNDINSPTESTLANPIGLAVDANGNLYVADVANARVMRFARPFDQTGIIRANLVLGQNTFFSKITDASRSSMRSPYGLAFTQNGSLLVSDASLNRVLLFQKPSGGDFTNGMAASAVFGQATFLTSAPGTDRSSLNSPHGIATDSSDRLYVADNGNGRISVFTGVFSGETNPPARFTAPIASPHGIAVNSRGEVWVTDLTNNRVIRFPIYEDWFNAPTSPISTIPAVRPFAVGLDSADNVLVAEATNRVSIFYIQATFRNAASYSQRGMAPGELALIARFGPSLNPSATAASATTLPWPTVLADTQVLVNGVAAPIFRVGPDIIAFQVPSSAPVNQFADVEVVRASTSEVLTAALFKINSADPAFFTSNAQGTGQIAALNAEDNNSVNSPTNPVGRGKIISLYGTGLGNVPNQPADGNASNAAISAPVLPRVSIINPGPGILPDANIKYFGLAPGLPGVWQLNILIPDTVAPSVSAQVAFFYQDWKSNEFINGNTSTLLTTTIAVK